MKKLIKPLIVFAIALLIVLILTVSLKSVGEKRRQSEQDFVFSYLLMDGAPFTQEAYDGEDDKIQRVFKGSNGYIIETKVPGYVDDITLWVGVKNEGYVTGITVREMNETFGLGRKVLYDVDYLLQYLRSGDDNVVGENIDAMTGATVTSKAITSAVNSSVAFVTGADVTSTATTWGSEE